MTGSMPGDLSRAVAHGGLHQAVGDEGIHHRGFVVPVDFLGHDDRVKQLALFVVSSLVFTWVILPIENQNRHPPRMALAVERIADPIEELKHGFCS